MSLIPIILNASNSRPPNCPLNQLIFNFPSIFSIKEAEVALSTFYCYYSWFNINNINYKNNSFSYIFNGVTTNVVMPDGYYSVADISGYLQFIMDQNGQYLVDENGNKVFFTSLVENSVYYAITLVQTPIPSVLPAGWTNPNSITLSGETPQLIINNSQFGLLIGFAPGTYPATPQTIVYDVNSTMVPQISPVYTVNIRCSFVNNPTINSFSDVIWTFSPLGLAFGSQIQIQPAFPLYYKANDGAYTQLVITLSDQNNNPINVIDPDMSITLLVRKKQVEGNR